MYIALMMFILSLVFAFLGYLLYNALQSLEFEVSSFVLLVLCGALSVLTLGYSAGMIVSMFN